MALMLLDNFPFRNTDGTCFLIDSVKILPLWLFSLSFLLQQNISFDLKSTILRVSNILNEEFLPFYKLAMTDKKITQ